MDLMSYDLSTLVIHVAIVALASLGNVEWLKNWIHPKRKRVYSVVGLIVLAINVIMQMPFIGSYTTWGWNLFSLGLAFMQFGYSALVKLPEMLIGKAIGKVKEEAG